MTPARHESPSATHPLLSALQSVAERLDASDAEQAAVAIEQASEACEQALALGECLTADELVIARQLEQRILEATTAALSALGASVVRAGTSRVALCRYEKQQALSGEEQ